MAAIKLLILFVILTSLVCPEIIEASTEKYRQNIKHKKITQNVKLKTKLKQASSSSKAGQRNGKMNYYNAHIWPTTATYYRPATSSLYPRASSTASSSIIYPIRWANSYINSPSFLSTNSLRRTDGFPSTPTKPTVQSSEIFIPNLNTPLLTMSSNSQMPTLYDMKAFTGNSGLWEHTSPDVWSIVEMEPPAPKMQLNLFKSFNSNDDGGLFGEFLNQFLK